MLQLQQERQTPANLLTEVSVQYLDVKVVYRTALPECATAFYTVHVQSYYKKMDSSRKNLILQLTINDLINLTVCVKKKLHPNCAEKKVARTRAKTTQFLKGNSTLYSQSLPAGLVTSRPPTPACLRGRGPTSVSAQRSVGPDFVQEKSKSFQLEGSFLPSLRFFECILRRTVKLKGC